MAKTVDELIMDFFRERPGQRIRHNPIVDWVTERYREEHGQPPRDVPRTTRTLAESGRLKKVGFGVFLYDPNDEFEADLLVFSPTVREAVFKRDNYRCKVCGLGKEDGINIAVDHKVAMSRGGEATVENGQTLCYKHNSMKKNYSQTEAGKRFVIETYNTAVEIGDQEMIDFCVSIFDAYDEHNINGHISRPDR